MRRLAALDMCRAVRLFLSILPEQKHFVLKLICFNTNELRKEWIIMEQFDQNDKIELTSNNQNSLKNKLEKEVFEWSEAIIIAVVIAVIIRSFCLRLLRLKGHPWKIPCTTETACL